WPHLDWRQGDLPMAERDAKGHFVRADPVDPTPAVADADILLPGAIPAIAGPTSAVDPRTAQLFDPPRLPAPALHPAPHQVSPAPISTIDPWISPRQPQLAPPIAAVGTGTAISLRSSTWFAPALAGAIAAAPAPIVPDPTRLQEPTVTPPYPA